MSKLPVKLRNANSEDVSFVFNSWLKSYRNALACKNVPNEIYFNEHHKLIERLVKNNKVVVACSETDSNELYGYICGGQSEGIFVLHYIYVKHSFRNMGIGKLLLNSFEHDPESASIYTHSTRVAEKLAPKYSMIYHPYLIINGDINDQKD